MKNKILISIFVGFLLLISFLLIYGHQNNKMVINEIAELENKYEEITNIFLQNANQQEIIDQIQFVAGRHNSNGNHTFAAFYYQLLELYSNDLSNCTFTEEHYKVSQLIADYWQIKKETACSNIGKHRKETIEFLDKSKQFYESNKFRHKTTCKKRT